MGMMSCLSPSQRLTTANLRTEILDFRGFDSSRLLILRGGIPWPIGNYQESLSQRILVGNILVGRLGVLHYCSMPRTSHLMLHGRWQRVAAHATLLHFGFNFFKSPMGTYNKTDNTRTHVCDVKQALATCRQTNATTTRSVMSFSGRANDDMPAISQIGSGQAVR